MSPRFAYERPAGGDERSPPEHSTCDALLVRERTILLERRPSDARVSPSVWDAPGGHVEPGESPEAALARELAEELGIEPSFSERVGVLDELAKPAGKRYRHFVFLVSAWRGEPAAREGQHLAWFPLAAALALEDLHPVTGHVLEELLEQGRI